MRFAEMGKEELQSLYDSLMTEYVGYKQQGLQLNMSRGKPAPEQLDLCAGVNECPTDFICEDGTDVRNYGAVSYTHLDVYKRQLLKISSTIAEILAKISRSGERCV